MNILVDTGAFYALSDRTDANHENATSFYANAVRGNSLVTTDFVLLEAWLLIRNKLGYFAAQNFWKFMRSGAIQIEYMTAADLDLAWEIVSMYQDQQFSIADATNFAIMERKGIGAAFAFDHHFRVYRFGSRRDMRFTVHP